MSGEIAHHGSRIDYVSICSPNYLHDAHIRFALRIQAGRGFGLLEAKPAVDIVSEIRRSRPVGLRGEFHLMLKRSRLG